MSAPFPWMDTAPVPDGYVAMPGTADIAKKPDGRSAMQRATDEVMGRAKAQQQLVADWQTEMAKRERLRLYEAARAQQIIDINNTRGRQATILSDVFNNTPMGGSADGMLR